LNKNTSYNLLAISTIGIFLGRGFQYFFRDAPLRVLLWDEEWMTPLLKLFGVAYIDFASNPQTDAKIVLVQKIIGVIFFSAACMSIFLLKKIENKPIKFFTKSILAVATLNLLLMAFCYTKDKFFHVGQFFEYAIQIGTPLLLLNYSFFERKISISIFLQIICALTFTCHGLYAVNFYNTPVEYTTMTMNSLGMDEAASKSFLQMAGLLDFIASILLFLPKTKKVTLIYMFIWGFLTTFARIYSHHHEDTFVNIFLQYWFQSMYRIGHFLVPLALLYGRFEKD
jgi:hypothetical protein